MELLQKTEFGRNADGNEENANVKEGRPKVTAGGDVTRIVASGSRTSEKEAELLSADVDDRRGTKDANTAGVGALRWHWRCPPETEQKDKPHRWTRKRRVPRAQESHRIHE